MAIVGLACPVSERGREPGRPSSSRPSAPDCTREYIVKEGAEDRLEALEDRARAAIGLERTLVLQELASARAAEAAAERAWRTCMGL